MVRVSSVVETQFEGWFSGKDKVLFLPELLCSFSGLEHPASLDDP